MDKQEQIEIVKELLEGVKELNGEYQEGWENVIENAENLINQLEQGSKLPIDSVIKSYSENNMDDAYDKGYNDGASAAATDIMNSL